MTRAPSRAARVLLWDGLRLMRNNRFFLPALSMGLLYSSIYIGLIIVNLRGSASDGRGDFGVLLHFALIACAALGLYFASKKGIERPLAALLALAGLVCLVLPFLSGAMAERIFNGRPPIMSMSMALFMPVSLFLFFRTIPTGRAGFAFALVIAGSELLWALLFPLLNGVSSQLPGEQQAFHLFSMCCWMVGGAGLCLGASLYRAAPVLPDTAAGVKGGIKGLLLIFAAGVGVFSMMGLHMGMLMPKTAVLPELIGIAHFVLLLLLPPAGGLLDDNPGKFMRMAVFGLAAVFLLGLFHEYGLIGRMPLFYSLNFMQSLLLLAAYTASARLLKNHALFPLLITLVHCLYITHIGGVALRGLVEALPYGLTAASLLLALGTGFCLWRFRMPETPAQPAERTLHPALRSSRLAAFAAAYGLSKREITVMEMLAQGRSSEEMAALLAVKAVTARTYIARLLQKTGTNSRAALLARYAAQNTDIAKYD